MSNTKLGISISKPLLNSNGDGIDIEEGMALSKQFDKLKIPYYFSYPYGTFLRNTNFNEEEYNGLIFIIYTDIYLRKSKLYLVLNPLNKNVESLKNSVCIKSPKDIDVKH